MVAAPVRVEATDVPEAQAASALNPNDPSGAFMLEHAAQAQAIQAEGGLPVLQPVKLDALAPGTFRFRTLPGYRRTSIYVRVYQPHPISEVNLPRKNAWERSKKQKYGAGWKDVIKPDQEIFEHNGQTEYQFNPIGMAAESEFTTDDPKVAAYIRYRLPELTHIYEEIQPLMVEIDGELVEVMPTTDKGRQAAARMQAGQR